jgi:hypothetical protein
MSDVDSKPPTTGSSDDVPLNAFGEPDFAVQSQEGPVLPSPAAAEEDEDTCRVCRGDGTPDHPLFHPCKCKGSIKYVHQDCLQEWLTQRARTHCELCHHPFQFSMYACSLSSFRVITRVIRPWMVSVTMLWRALWHRARAHQSHSAPLTSTCTPLPVIFAPLSQHVRGRSSR